MKNFVRNLFGNQIEEKVKAFIERATELGLRSEDRENALEMLEHNEAGEAFDIVVSQLYEFDIKINRELLDLAYETGDAMKIDRSSYEFLEKLLPTD